MFDTGAKEAAEALGVNVATLIRYAKARGVTSAKRGTRYLFDMETLRSEWPKRFPIIVTARDIARDSAAGLQNQHFQRIPPNTGTHGSTPR